MRLCWIIKRTTHRIDTYLVYTSRSLLPLVIGGSGVKYLTTTKYLEIFPEYVGSPGPSLSERNETSQLLLSSPSQKCKTG